MGPFENAQDNSLLAFLGHAGDDNASTGTQHAPAFGQHARNQGRVEQLQGEAHEHDTPALAAKKESQYIQEYGRPESQHAWHFLTGDEASIKRLTDAVGFHYRYDAEHKQFLHPMGLMVLTPQGKLSRYFYGVGYEPVDLRLSLVQASNDRIGTVADQILLLCCQYDPTTGRYDWAVRRILNVGGAVTVLVLGGFIYKLVRLERRAAAQSAAPEAPPADQRHD